MPPVEYEQLIERMNEIQDLSGAASVLSWDLETYLPPKGLGHRARQLSTLSGLIHSKATDSEVGRLLDALERAPTSESLSETERAVVSETRYDFERASKLPEDLVRDLARTTSLATEAWRRARAESNFALFADPLKKIIDLLRRKAEAYGYEQIPYDALIEDYERGMTAEKIRPIFDGLRENLSTLVKALHDQPGVGGLGWRRRPRPRGGKQRRAQPGVPRRRRHPDPCLVLDGERSHHQRSVGRLGRRW